jgi:hypothetical protein
MGNLWHNRGLIFAGQHYNTDTTMGFATLKELTEASKPRGRQQNSISHNFQGCINDKYKEYKDYQNPRNVCIRTTRRENCHSSYRSDQFRGPWERAKSYSQGCVQLFRNNLPLLRVRFGIDDTADDRQPDDAQDA